jgi:putative membrane-bound dehydrogenase-like protein
MVNQFHMQTGESMGHNLACTLDAESNRQVQGDPGLIRLPPFFHSPRICRGGYLRTRMISRSLALLAFLSITPVQRAEAETNANRLTYLDENDPFFVGPKFPKLTTPQWVGESGVEAVVILAIDDMRDPQRYETFLRPVLDRLKQIDGRAPVSIFCNQLDAQNPQLQTWLKEGLSLEVHTLTHPCPLLANSNFVAAAANYHDCVDLLNRVPGNKPLAFRMPCCDSMNSPSPRFYAEMFNRVSSTLQFLTIDSSVMNLTTANDKSLPRALVMDGGNRERFRKYFPAETNSVTKLSLKWFGTTIEDYPYPYVIGKLCWEFPPMVPSDWEANNAQGPNNAQTVADWKAALDATMLKQGTFTFIFHPHGWIRAEQLLEFIDYADKTYGRKVKFLNFREAQERLDKNLLLDQPLRAANGQDNGVRLLDLNNDGYLDVICANEHVRQTRVWNPNERTWIKSGFPMPLVEPGPQGRRQEAGVKFGIIHADGRVSALIRNEAFSRAWTFEGAQWIEDAPLLDGLEVEGKPIFTAARDPAGGMRDRGVRLRDLDRDGGCELIIGNESQNAAFAWSEAERSWKRLPYGLPGETSVVDGDGRDNGLRFVDINDDGYDDVLFSNENAFALHLFIATPKSWLGWERGWTFKVASGKRGEPVELPMVVRGGTNRNNGAWFRAGQMWVQNEATAHGPDKVERRSFSELLTLAEPPPKSPEASLRAIRVRPGFKVELVVSEPLIVDPVAFDWGPDGKFWVVEMRDYPLGIPDSTAVPDAGRGNESGPSSRPLPQRSGYKPGGVVKYLEDTDGDGRYDKATVFLEHVNFPNGVMVWRKGVLISAAPEIFYAEDTDGDGKADIRKPLLVGFNEGNQQHRVNGFEYGLDNWVYAANGGSGGTIRSVSTGKTANLRGHDLRFKPDTGEFELVEGQTQFGRHRDDWGNWFGNENPTWLWHYFLPEHYLARNSDLAVTTTRRVLANYPNATRVYPVSRPQQRFNWPEAASNLTSANSPTPYRDTLFGPDFASSVFVSEPAQNVVHREVLESNGVTFASHRASDEQDREFLASSDNWFRPTMLKTGPDGALYIADIYRRVIEHPEYFPEELKTRPDLRAGDDKGRIYRVYPEGAQLRPVPRLDRLARKDLVQRLASTNGWERDLAQRMLLWRDEQPAESELRLIGAADLNPKARIQALSTMSALGLITPAIALSGLRDPHPAVKEFALRLSEPFLRAAPAKAADSDLTAALLQLVADASVRVRYQLALTLGEWNDPRAAQALARIALKDHDPDLQTALLSSAKPHAAEMLDAILAETQSDLPADVLASLLNQVIGSPNPASAAKAFRRLGKPSGDSYAAWQMATTAAFLDTLERRSQSLKEFRDNAPAALKEAIGKLDGLFDYARQTAETATASEADQLLAIRLLGRGPGPAPEDAKRLGGMLHPRFSGPLQQAALDRLKRINDPQAGKALLAGWKQYAPSLRTEVLNGLLSRTPWTGELLAAMESGLIGAAEIGPVHRQRLLRHSAAEIRERAEKLFAASASDRQKVIKAYDAVNRLTGNAERGGALYRQNCGACHRLRGEGTNLGPDLGTVADKPVETLLVAILDPNQAFETKYINYTAVTRGDREISGIIAVETPNSITLRNVGGTEETMLRSDIKELTSSRLSFMPEGFENTLTPQDMADLIASIRSR